MLKRLSAVFIVSMAGGACSDDSSSTLDGGADTIDDASGDFDSVVTPAAIPANTTDCTTNAAGCLEAATNSTAACVIELDATIGSSVTVLVDGTLSAGRRASIRINAYAEESFGQDGSSFWQGYTARMSRSGFIPNMPETATRSLHDSAGLSLASDSWSIDGADFPVSIQASFDSAATSGSASFVATGAPTEALASTAMSTSKSDKLVITVTGGEVCNVVVMP